MYEIIEDYKDAKTREKKDEIFNSFFSSIWASDNKRRIYTKSINFKVRKDLLGTDLGKVFDVWSAIEYKYYKSMTKDDNWCSLIRQKINNIYTRYFDKEVILGKEYMDLLKKPKRLYYDWISGTEMEPDKVTEIIDDAISDSLKAKERLQKEKMSLSLEDYKKVIEGFLHTAFDNCKLIGDYEDKTSLVSRFDFFTEDHFYVKYFNRSLDGEIRKWQKRYYGIAVTTRKKYDRCIDCSNLYIKKTNNQHRCIQCQKVHTRKTKTLKQRKYRVEKLKNHTTPINTSI